MRQTLPNMTCETRSLAPGKSALIEPYVGWFGRTSFHTVRVWEGRRPVRNELFMPK